MREYEQGLSIFRYIRNKNKNWRREGIYDEDLVYVDEEGNNHYEKSVLKSIKLAFYHNLAAVYLRIHDYQSALFACD